MNHDDANKVAAAVSDADGGCINCVSRLMYDLDAAFPEHDWPTLIGAHLNTYFGEAHLRASLAEHRELYGPGEAVTGRGEGM